jgi:Tfp pilus assembly protein PilO
VHRDFTLRRRLIIGALAVLLVADAGLAVLSWHLATRPRTPEQNVARQASQVKVLKGDIDRVAKIRQDLPKTIGELNDFEKSQFFAASTGYSSVTAEVGELAKKAGLRLQGISFHQVEVKGRPLYEIQMDAQVSGDYLGVVKFLNGLQRSQDVYVVDSLALATEAQGNGNDIRVNLHMRTYFRAEA